MRHALVRQWLIARTPLEPTLLDGAGFDALVAERIAVRPGMSEAAYLAALEASPEELDRLISGIAVPETWFFRYPRSFDCLIHHLQRLRASGASTLCMTSIGCATGEEPHTMAMAALHAGWPAHAISIDALDRSAHAIARARASRYASPSIRSEIPAWAAAHLRHGPEGDIVIDPATAALSRFIEADVTHPGFQISAPPRDVIFCRNLLIYLHADARRHLLQRMTDALAPGGLLFVGHAEPLLCAGRELRAIAEPHAFVLERAEPSAARPPRATAPPVFKDAGRPATATSTHPRPVLPSIDDARSLADAGRSAESESLLRTHMRRAAPTAEAFELLGMLRMAAGDTAQARRFFEEAVRLDPLRTAALLQLAMIAEHDADAHTAAAYWERARRSDPPASTEAHS